MGEILTVLSVLKLNKGVGIVLLSVEHSHARARQASDLKKAKSTMLRNEALARTRGIIIVLAPRRSVRSVSCVSPEDEASVRALARAISVGTNLE
jgi:hypothetical protein